MSETTTAATSLDLKQLDPKHAANTPRPMTLKDPVSGEPLVFKDPETGEPRTPRLWYLGLDSDKAKEKRREIQNRGLARIAKKGKSTRTAQQNEREKVELIAALCTAWEYVPVDGAFVEFSVPMSVQVHKDLDFVTEQADEFLSDRENYAGNS